MLVQRFDPNDPSNLVKQEFRTVSVASGLTLTLTTTSGAPTPTTTLGAGDFIVAYGNTDNGAGRGNIIYRNVEGQPIVRLHAGIDSYADFTSPATTTRIAYGDLNGFSGLSSQTFGFFAGADDGDHVLIKDDGLFFKKDNSTVLAELTSNTFKVGDTTNFLSFNGSAFNIQTNTFDLATSTLVVDSTANKIALGASADSITIDGTEVGFIADGSGEFKAFLDANNFIRLANSSLNIKSQQFNLESSTIQLGDSIELSTSQITTTYDYSGSTLVFSGLFNNTYNYFGYLEDIDDINPDGYVFRVGDATNFMELNTANNIAQIKFDTFDLTSGNLGIKSEGTSFPSASINDSSTSTPNTSFLSNVEVVPVDASDNNTVRFKFDYSVNFSTSFSTNFKIRVEGRLTGTTTWQDITLYTDLEYIQHAYTIVTQTLGTINVANESGPTEVFLRATGSGSSQYAGTITFYLFVSPDSNFDGFRLALDEVGGNASSADASNISGISYDSNLELNPNGVFIRLSDTLVNSNGNIFQDRALLTS